LYGAGAFNGILFMTSKSPFDFQGISAYFKTGITSQEAAGDNNYYDFGIRAAHAFSDRLAVKASFSFLKGEDWHANSRFDLNNPGGDRSNPTYNGVNVYGDDAVITRNLDFLAGLPSGTLGSHSFTRTGYDESAFANYNAESLKTDFAVHYRPFGDDLELIYNGRIGRGTTIYQGASRYAVDGFTMQQHKLELKNDNFFIRGYIVSENSGNAYDTRFAAINVNRRWKSDNQWGADYLNTYIGAKLGVGTGIPATDEQAEAAARAAADTGRFEPGTPEFQRAFNAVIADGDLTTGAKFIDQTKFRHINGNYNLAHLINDWADIQVGGSWREYELNSQGTIFTDFDGPISYQEFGGYVQLQKKIADERLKLTLSGRYDKNEFFDGFFSPRAGVSVTLGEKRNHNVRASVQQGFRNPTTQDLFIGLNAGLAILVGSAPDNLDRDVRTFSLSPQGQTITGQTSAQVVGRAAYENSFSVSSLANGVIEAADVNLVQPEEITTFELGYRAQLGKFTVDMSAYYNEYSNFISNTTVLVPLYGEVGDNSLSLLALQNDDVEPYQTYTNSPEEITSYGGNIGVNTKVFGNFDLGVNYTYTFLEDAEGLRDRGVRTNFNTPEHKFKASFGHTEILPNLGFGLNYRWSDAFFWEASFADGDVPSFNVFDAQVNYSVPSIDSIFKLGGSNILNQEYFQAFGSGFIGAIYYVSWTINP
jgi:hypothetical protein